MHFVRWESVSAASHLTNARLLVGMSDYLTACDSACTAGLSAQFESVMRGAVTVATGLRRVSSCSRHRRVGWFREPPRCPAKLAFLARILARRGLLQVNWGSRRTRSTRDNRVEQITFLHAGTATLQSSNYIQPRGGVHSCPTSIAILVSYGPLLRESIRKLKYCESLPSQKKSPVLLLPDTLAHTHLLFRPPHLEHAPSRP